MANWLMNMLSRKTKLPVGEFETLAQALQHAGQSPKMSLEDKITFANHMMSHVCDLSANLEDFVKYAYVEEERKAAEPKAPSLRERIKERVKNMRDYAREQFVGGLAVLKDKAGALNLSHLTDKTVSKFRAFNYDNNLLDMLQKNNIQMIAISPNGNIVRIGSEFTEAQMGVFAERYPGKTVGEMVDKLIEEGQKLKDTKGKSLTEEKEAPGKEEQYEELDKEVTSVGGVRDLGPLPDLPKEYDDLEAGYEELEKEVTGGGGTRDLGPMPDLPDDYEPPSRKGGPLVPPPSVETPQAPSSENLGLPPFPGTPKSSGPVAPKPVPASAPTQPDSGEGKTIGEAMETALMDSLKNISKDGYIEHKEDPKMRSPKLRSQMEQGRDILESLPEDKRKIVEMVLHNQFSPELTDMMRKEAENYGKRIDEHEAEVASKMAQADKSTSVEIAQVETPESEAQKDDPEASF